MRFLSPSSPLLPTFYLLTAPLAHAQQTPSADPSTLPGCATPALLQILNDSGCFATDTKCLCSWPNIRQKLTAAVEAACPDKQDQQMVQRFGDAFCPALAEGTTKTTTTATKGGEGVLTTDSGVPVTTTTTREEVFTKTRTMNGTVVLYAAPATMTTTGSNGGGEAGGMTTTRSGLQPSETGGANGLGVNAWFGLVAAVAGMTWAFAEL